MKNGMRKVVATAVVALLTVSLSSGALAAPLFTSKGFRLPTVKHRPVETPEPVVEETVEPTEAPVETPAPQDDIPATESVAAVVVVEDGVLNVYAHAGEASEPVAKLSNGDAVTILGRDGDWARVRMADGKEGYAMLKCLATEIPTADPTEEPAVDPTAEPVVDVTADPTEEPATEPTAEPVIDATVEPTEEPAVEPTMEPVVDVTAEPTEEPAAEPTAEPVVDATVEPTEEPAADQAVESVAAPTAAPTIRPVRDLVVPKPEAAVVGEADVRVSNDGLSEIFITLPEGTPLTVVAVMGDWLQVEVDGQIGYIYKDSVAGVEFEQPEIDESAEIEKKVTIFSSRRSIMTPGETVWLTSKLEGFEDCEIIVYQWQYDRGNGFEDIPDADEDTYSFAADAEWLNYDWRLMVYYG